MRDRAARRNRERARLKIAPYSQQLGDFFTGGSSVLVKNWAHNYSAELGKDGFIGDKPRKSQPLLPPAAPVARPQPGGGVWERSRRGGREHVRGGTSMATALVDLYGDGEDFEPFDRIILSESYRPSESEKFMCGRHRAYFLRKLKVWKEAIIEESRQTMAQLQVDSLREPDLADRASSETDWSIELRTRDRQRKLIAKIDCAVRRLYEGEYGYCEVTGEPISLGRLEARPIATMTLEAQECHERIEKVSRDD
jgi:DnaK suppressor protein